MMHFHAQTNLHALFLCLLLSKHFGLIFSLQLSTQMTFSRHAYPAYSTHAHINALCLPSQSIYCFCQAHNLHSVLSSILSVSCILHIALIVDFIILMIPISLSLKYYCSLLCWIVDLAYLFHSVYFGFEEDSFHIHFTYFSQTSCHSSFTSSNS